MAKQDKISILGTVEAWEDGTLGRDEAHVRVAPPEAEEAFDEAMGLQSISIRLPRTLIQTFKDLAQVHGVGYQPLMRDALDRFALAEMKHLVSQMASERAQQAAPQAAQTKMRKVA